MVNDVALLTGLVVITVERLSNGNMHAVNRPRVLMDNGILKPMGDDIVPDSVRALWI